LVNIQLTGTFHPAAVDDPPTVGKVDELDADDSR
jgi:hypothetical protein